MERGDGIERSISAAAGSGEPAQGRRRHRRARAFAGLFLAFVLIHGQTLTRFAFAQSVAQGQPTIALAPILFAEAGGSAKLAIRVRPSESAEAGSFVRIRGLPPSATLSEGYLIATGVWAVPLFGLAELSVNLPGGTQGRSDLTISLVNVEGTTLAEVRTVLVVVPPGAVKKNEPEAKAEQAPQQGAAQQAQPAPIQPPVPQLARPQQPAISPADRARATSMLASGAEHLKQGNIAAARRFFERAVELGSAPAAIALGDTFEPGELARLRALGIQPDIEAARKWYMRAQELGSPDAPERLRQLSAQ